MHKSTILLAAIIGILYVCSINLMVPVSATSRIVVDSSTCSAAPLYGVWSTNACLLESDAKVAQGTTIIVLRNTGLDVSAGTRLLNSGTIVVNGSFTVEAGASMINDGSLVSKSHFVNVSGNLTNTSTGVVMLTASAGSMTVYGHLINYGTITCNQQTSLDVDGILQNRAGGIIIASGGTIDTHPIARTGVYNEGGKVIIASKKIGATTYYGSLSNLGNFTNRSGGQLVIMAGVDMANFGNIFNSGHSVIINSGIVNNLGQIVITAPSRIVGHGLIADNPVIYD